MEIKVLGAAREVGRSAFLVKGATTNILLDFGVQMQREPAFPMHVQAKDVDAILLSHAHLDHSGGTPIFFLSNGTKMYTTDLTLELTKLLIEDMLRISGFYLPFEYLDLTDMLKKTTQIKLGQTINIGDFEAKFLDAGHIPGSTSIILDQGGKRILYTGDVNAEDTQLLRGSNQEFGECDFVITESTYATQDHPVRNQVETEFVSFAKEVVERGGTLFVPAFSVGRSQEIACVLNAANFPYQVSMDGMALKTNEVFLRYQEYLRDAAAYRRSLSRVEMITSWSQRNKLVKSPGVIISPAGMLVGGAATFYNQEVSQKAKNAISIVAFQIPGTPGRTLLEKGIALVRGKPTKVKAEVRRFDFSSHSGQRDLHRMLEKIKGNPKVVMVHGEEETCLSFAKTVREKYGLESFAPTPGETYRV
jgi:putative mRNA 3-end processing factor